MHNKRPPTADATRTRRVVGPWALAALAAGLGGLLRAEELAPGPERQANLLRVEALWRGRRVGHGSDDDVMVRRGLMADRSERRLLLDVEATGLGAREIVEFPIITEGSGRSIEIEDPLQLSVRDFLSACQRGARPHIEHAHILETSRMLQQVYACWPSSPLSQEIDGGKTSQQGT